MSQQKTAAGVFTAILAFILILDRETSIASARAGIQVCLQSVIPSLFPFMVLSSMINSFLVGKHLYILDPIAKFCCIPLCHSRYLIPSFLGGYPVGAQIISADWKQGRLSKEEANRMLSFCSNAGPAFLMGIIMPQFTAQWMAWALWGIHIGTALIIGSLLPQASILNKCPCTSDQRTENIMKQSIQSLSYICSWVILFHIITGSLSKWVLFRFPILIQAAATGLLELTTGCCLLYQIQNEELRFILCAGLLGFGGICVLMQTISAVQGLSIQSYLKGKILQCILSMAAACLIVSGLWYILMVLLGLFVLIVMKLRRHSRIFLPYAV